ncbi:hypothetical protein ZIOFF_057042 [Zingiber officinale]|uniref:Glutathione S-transferase n=1 Tax=Zingiber officinale TaxID=94328 RepID=A0A8J5KLE6_ZINOF|nr:hypothetical protein ZIOFF_057042 [Zingiber officinale]
MAGVAAEDVKVLSDPLNPFVIRVLIALRLKRVEYEFMEVQLAEPKSKILVKSNPYIDKEWFDNGRSSSFLPANPYNRAIARFWAAYIDDKSTSP